MDEVLIPHTVLLAILAHPDDESFGPGGTLALYAKRGVEVHLICATKGEAGEVEPELLEPHRSIADLRVHELLCAADILGLSSVRFLDYRDSGMVGSEDNRHPASLVSAPIQEVIEQITHAIRELQPQVVITFDPMGGYGHPDHIAVHQAATAAFHAAGDRTQYPGEAPPYQPQKLYYTTFPRRQLRWLVRCLPLFGQNPRRFGRNQDIDLLEIVGKDYPIHARIDYREVREAREQAAACHASQLAGGLSRSGILGRIYRAISTRPIDVYMRAYPVANHGKLEWDLFAGVTHAPPDPKP